MKKMLLIALIISITLYINSYKQENIIPDEAIRFRIIANSNSIDDQNVKIIIRNEVENKLLSLLNDSKTIDESRNIIKNNMKNIDQIVNNKLKELNYNQKYTIKYGKNYFPSKKYKGIRYKSGTYESLVITLGKGDGNNFWCVLFPPLCLIENEDTKTSDIEYKFAIKELIDRYLK